MISISPSTSRDDTTSQQSHDDESTLQQRWNHRNHDDDNEPLHSGGTVSLAFYTIRGPMNDWTELVEWVQPQSISCLLRTDCGNEHEGLCASEDHFEQGETKPNRQNTNQTRTRTRTPAQGEYA